MKNVIINQQNAVSGFPTAPPTRVGISPVSPSRARHAAMLLLVFVCQTPASPGRVTRSLEALPFVPLPRLILLENRTNRYSCREQELSAFRATGKAPRGARGGGWGCAHGVPGQVGAPKALSLSWAGSSISWGQNSSPLCSVAPLHC